MAGQVLTIDIGGTNVKMRVEGDPEKRSFPSGSHLTPEVMVAGVRELTAGWSFDRISIGFPAPIVHNKPVHDPMNLGAGWVNFDFDEGFAAKVKLINDAAMQAVGSYEGGRMLFLGLGTGLGSCMIAENVIIPTELAHLPYKKGKTFEKFVGVRAFKKNGKRQWSKDVREVIQLLSIALMPDYVVLGGGNATRLKRLPEGCRLGDNANAFTGGFRLWTPQWAASTPVYDR